MEVEMTEKTMVADTLASINGELTRYAEMISQSENPQLKQVLKTMRSQCEMAQEEIFQLAREHSYYIPSADATQDEIDHVKQLFCNED